MSVAYAVISPAGPLVLPPLDVVSVQATMDEGWQPYVQATITAVGAAAWAIDPLAVGGWMLNVELYQDGVMVGVLARLSVRSVVRNQATGAVTIQAASAESDVMTRHYLSSSTPLGPSTWAGIREGVQDLLGRAGQPSGFIDLSALPLGTSPALAQGVVIQPGDPWWDPLQDLPQRIGWHVYVDNQGIWRLANADPTPGTPTTTITLGVDLEELSTTISRDTTGAGQWGDAAACVYTWNDSTGSHRVIGTAGAVAIPTRVVRIDTAMNATQAQADARAAKLRDRVYKRGRTYQVTLPGVQLVPPRQHIALAQPSGTTTVYVAAWTTSLPDATTTLTLRAAS